MNRQEKEQVVKELHGFFEQSSASFLVNYKGLTVAQLQQLRRQLHGLNSTMHVAKARLMKIAAQDMTCGSDLAPHLKDQVALVFAKDSTATAKALYDFSKQNQGPQLLVGCIDAQLVDKDMLITIATLPSRDQLLAQVAGVMKAPIARLVFALKALIEQKGGMAGGSPKEHTESGAPAEGSGQTE